MLHLHKVKKPQIYKFLRKKGLVDQKLDRLNNCKNYQFRQSVSIGMRNQLQIFEGNNQDEGGILN